MSKKVMTAATGKLSVQLTSDSMFLGQCVPVEVRDSDMRLVQQSMSARQFELPVGLYEVSAVLEDGRRHSVLVQVKDGQQTPVELGAEEESWASGGMNHPGTAKTQFCFVDACRQPCRWPLRALWHGRCHRSRSTAQ